MDKLTDALRAVHYDHASGLNIQDSRVTEDSSPFEKLRQAASICAYDAVMDYNTAARRKAVEMALAIADFCDCFEASGNVTCGR